MALNRINTWIPAFAGMTKVDVGMAAKDLPLNPPFMGVDGDQNDGTLCIPAKKIRQ